ncbi:hypothetical protein [Cellulomonas telluris]|uniref:hypothetical protein n=1 Tax=Cellulomonas telluris TaxID=2306636 RepID=UPI0010A87316|nr:hypothetical protein [Cellulomonas telluris]
MPTDRARRTLPVAAAVLALVACAPSLTPGELQARDVVLDLLATTRMSSHTESIDGFARAAVGTPSGTTLVGIEPAEGFERGDVLLGTLTFAVTLPEPADAPKFSIGEPDEVDRGPHCFAVRFDRWGKVGEWGEPDGVDRVDCPPGVVEVTPPPSDVPVAAEDARDAAWQVLEELPAGGTPDADDVAERITALLAPVEPGGPPLADVDVEVEGADVGVATGGPDDCVLVARVGGTVVDVHVAPVQLQPGELGCRPSTALAMPAPPH